jgi:hypothetical protein
LFTSHVTDPVTALLTSKASGPTLRLLEPPARPVSRGRS